MVMIYWHRNTSVDLQLYELHMTEKKKEKKVSNTEWSGFEQEVEEEEEIFPVIRYEQMPPM